MGTSVEYVSVGSGRGNHRLSYLFNTVDAGDL